MSDVTRILSQVNSGDASAADELLLVVYDELRKLASVKLAQEKPGQTLQATALVHEAYLKLVGTGSHKGFASRRHFFSAAAEAMRRILVDQARRKQTVRHGGQWHRLSESQELPDPEQGPEQTIAIHELLGRLVEKDARSAEVAKMRLFLEMTYVEIAEVLGISADTAQTDWAYARAWLQREWQSGS